LTPDGSDGYSGPVSSPHVQLRFEDVSLRGVRVRWGEVGSGPPLVLVHGFLVSHREWLPMLPYLAEKLRCIVIDLPGFGASEKPPGDTYGYTREAFADTVADLMSGLSLTRAHLVGHSMGGGISLTLAADRPELVDRLCVIDSMSYPFEVPLKGRLPLLPVVGPVIFKRLYGRALMRDYFRNDVWSGHPGIDMAAVDAYFDDFDPAASREASYTALQRTVDTAPLVPKIARVRSKTLVVWGDDDRIFPLALGKRLAKEIAGARLRVIQGSGHAPNEEHAQTTAEIVLAHLLGTED
jgi:pimeloyl-ACP methyl ester carboxylesterase